MSDDSRLLAAWEFGHKWDEIIRARANTTSLYDTAKHYGLSEDEVRFIVQSPENRTKKVGWPPPKRNNA